MIEILKANGACRYSSLGQAQRDSKTHKLCWREGLISQGEILNISVNKMKLVFYINYSIFLKLDELKLCVKGIYVLGGQSDIKHT